ncbi:4Fe-4S binding protein [bacterium]
MIQTNNRQPSLFSKISFVIIPNILFIIFMFNKLENMLSNIFSNIKLVENALLGLEGSYVELLTILALALLAVIPIIVPKKNRQLIRHLNQIFGIFVFIFVVFTCLGVFGMIRNFVRGLNEIGRENIIALYYCSVPVMIIVTSMIFGSLFCGWICPTGALQEFIGFLTKKQSIDYKKKGYPFSKKMLIMTIAVALIFIGWIYRLSITRMFFVEDASIYWSEILIILLFILVFKQKQWDMKLRRLRIISFFIILVTALLSMRITSPVHFGFAKVYDPASFLATIMVVLAAIVVPRIWCKYLCPWRTAIAWCSKHSVRTIEFDKSKCIWCDKCTYVCQVDAIDRGNINFSECHMCLACVDICPTSCLNLKDNWKIKHEKD